MAWTTPKTWAHADATTGALFNTHIRDNFSLLKTSFSDGGRLSGLTASFLADLSGANLTGVALPGVANTFTVGTQDFNAGTATIVLPVGADLYDGAPGNKTAGSVWVEGNYLHWISSTQVEWRFAGTGVAAATGGALAGSIWVDTTTSAIHYINSAGSMEYWVPSSNSPHSDSASIRGSVWVDTSYLHWIGAAGYYEYQAHMDTHTNGTVHSDGAHTDTHVDTHGNVAHSNTAHADTHANHTDVGHADSHGNISHVDVSHTDTYSDTHGNVAHVNHSDHGDVAHDDRPENMGT